MNSVSENTNRRDDLGRRRRGASTLLIIFVILISAVLLGYAINVKVQGSAQQNPTDVKQSAVQYGQNGMRNLNNLFGNFSSMSLVYNSTTSDGSRDTMRASYNVLGVAIINGVRTFKVNVTGDETTNGQRMDESLVAWIDASSGRVIQTYDNEDGTLVGTKARQEESVLSIFTTEPWLSTINSSTVARVTGSGQSVTLGQVSLQVTTYEGLQSFSAYKDWTIKVGTLPSNGAQLVLFCSYLSSFGDYQNTFQIVSIT